MSTITVFFHHLFFAPVINGSPMRKLVLVCHTCVLIVLEFQTLRWGLSHPSINGLFVFRFCYGGAQNVTVRSLPFALRIAQDVLLKCRYVKGLSF